MRDNFIKARRILRKRNAVAVNGCCYGRERNEDRGDYYKICGQRFWSLISGNEALYTDMIEPLGHRARERNEEFHNRYTEVINCFTKEFSALFCDEKGMIVWQNLVRFSSGPTKPSTAS